MWILHDGTLYNLEDVRTIKGYPDVLGIEFKDFKNRMVISLCFKDADSYYSFHNDLVYKLIEII